jgi:hypothetical protein
MVNRCFQVFLLITVLAWVMPGKAAAYIMPAGQIVGLMTSNFSKFKTLMITQSIHELNPRNQETEMVLEEKLWLKSPCFFRSEPIVQAEGQGRIGDETGFDRQGADMAFRRLFLASDGKAIMEFLFEMGINLESVAFTRFDDLIAYRLGDKDPESPKLLIEKDRFIPLFLSYRVRADSGPEMVNVRFYDYRKLESGWYPYEVAYYLGEEIMERYTVLDLQTNISIEGPLSEIPVEGLRLAETHKKSPDTPEREGLRELINLFKEKYR